MHHFIFKQHLCGRLCVNKIPNLIDLPTLSLSVPRDVVLGKLAKLLSIYVTRAIGPFAQWCEQGCGTW